MKGSDFIRQHLDLYKEIRGSLKAANGAKFIELIECHRHMLDVDSPFGTWLHVAAKYGAIDAIKYLLKTDIDVNHRSGALQTNALGDAAAEGNYEVISLLLDAGCEFDTSEPYRNPLFLAIQKGHTEAVKLLVERGIDTSVTHGDSNRDAIQFAKEWGHLDIVEILGGDPNRPIVWVETSIPDMTGQRPNDDKISAIEKELRISIPQHYREFLLEQFPSELFFPEAPDNDRWKWLGPDHRLFHTARSFIAYNAIDPGVDVKALQFPEHLVIGTDSGGDCWCIDRHGRSKWVYIHCHESDCFASTGLTIREHAASLLLAES